VKLFVAATLALLIALSFVARATRPRPVDPSKIPLVWSSDDNPRRGPQIDPFNALHPDLHLQLDPNNTETEKVVVQSLGGIGPDLFDCYNGSSLSAFVKAGIAWDVTDELKQMGIDVQKETWTAGQRCCVLEGRVYGFPGNAAVNALWFHKDICRDAGVEIPNGPWTWEQALPILQKLTARDGTGKITRYGLLLDWSNNYLQFIYQWGGRMYTPDGTRCTLDSPQCIAAIAFMQDLIFKYKVLPSAAAEAAINSAGGYGSSGAGAITLFGARRGATALGGRWWLCALREPDYAGLQLGAVEAPHGQVRTFAGYGKATLVNRNGPHRREALQWLVYLHSEPYNRLINHQADGVGPVMKYTQDDSFLHDPDYPNEDYNAVWRDMQRIAVPEQISPFMNGAVLQRLIDMQLELVKSGDKSAADAMRDATKQVNDRIQENLRQSPALREQWERLTRGQS
jgi:multiple sugar transport system substrate-binding protein